MGIADGSAREIAILSRVGKPVCFQVLGFTSDGTVLLTRRAARPRPWTISWTTCGRETSSPAWFKTPPVLAPSATLAAESQPS